MRAIYYIAFFVVQLLALLSASCKQMSTIFWSKRFFTHIISSSNIQTIFKHMYQRKIRNLGKKKFSSPQKLKRPTSTYIYILTIMDSVK